MPIGNIVWRDKFFSPKSISFSLTERLDIATAVSKSVFDGIIIGVRKAGWDETYASSGTVKMPAAICKAHGFGKGEIELALLLNRLFGSGGDLPGLKERQRELLLSGVAV